MKDKYKNFKGLEVNEKEGVDFVVEKDNRGSEAAIIAIHGGKIEPGTSEVAKEIAGDDLSLYSFMGKKRNNNTDLHITSVNFDEPAALEFVSRHKVIVSIHGMRGSFKGFVMLGGLHKELKSKIASELKKAGFSVLPALPGFRAVKPENICNKGASGKGIQIEISRKLRNKLLLIMGRREVGEENIRKLTRMGREGASIGLTLPKEIVDKLGWRERQKVVVEEKNGRITIKDWKKK